MFHLVEVCKSQDKSFSFLPIYQPTSAFRPNYDTHHFVLFNAKAYPDLFFQFFHIFKTAGTTFNYITGSDKISNNCGLESCCHRDGPAAAYRIISNSYLNDMNCGYISYELPFHMFESIYNGSLDTNLLDRQRKRKFLPMIVFREPLQHAFSALSHMSRHHPTTACTSLSMAMNLSQPCYRYPHFNPQSRFLASKGKLHTALEMLPKFFFVGITEYFDASMCVLSYQLGQFRADRCNCADPGNYGVAARRNVASTSYSRFTSTHAEVEQLSSMLTMDRVLYHEAVILLMKRIALVEQKTKMKILCDSEKLDRESTAATNYIMGEPEPFVEVDTIAAWKRVAAIERKYDV